MGYRIRYGARRRSFVWLLCALTACLFLAAMGNGESLARYVGGCIRGHIG